VLGRLQKRPPGKLFFVDQEGIDGAERWQPTLTNALQNCRMMLMLYAPGYFGRPVCGQEVSLLLQRQNQAASEGYLLPVHWVPLGARGAPASVKDIQYWWKELPKDCETKGLESLCRRKSGLGANDYQQALIAYAERIVEILEQKPALPALAPAPPLLTMLPDVFAPAAPAPGAPLPAVAAPPVGAAGLPDVVNLTVIAGTQTDLNGRKQSLNYYGARDIDWQPFPQSRLKPAQLVQNVATREKFLVYPCRADAQLPDVITRAQTENSLMVVVVDIWSVAFVADYEQRAKSVDVTAGTTTHTTVMVLWNDADPDEAHYANQLKAQCADTFDVQRTRDSTFFRGEIRNAGDLESAVLDCLIKLQQRIVERVQNKSLLESSRFRQKPTIANAPAAVNP